ncbi:MAG: subtype A tannase [Corynebacterium sp.]|nr:subtype A tannase [Corynebacterium sp.]
MRMRRSAATLAIISLSSGMLVACSTGSTESQSSSTTARATQNVDYSALSLASDQWLYDAENDVYYQLGLQYVTDPQASEYETLGIYIPGAYVDAVETDNGTFEISFNDSASVGDYTAATAPWVLPVNTPGYSAQTAPTEYNYDDVAEYLEAGLIYVWPGIRGKDSNTTEYTGNAPWGVTDIKAAIRYVRYNAGVLPGNTEQLFVFGHSGGGAQSTIVGASGDSELYTPYLEEIGAAFTDADGTSISDAVAGVMAWCPITSLDEANLGYEWQMGQFSNEDTRAAGTWTKAYSDDLAAAFKNYINSLELENENGEILSLEDSEDGIALAGSYYEELMTVIENSLNDFLDVTSFPYTPSNSFMAGMGTGTRAAESDGSASASGENTSTAADSEEAPAGEMPSNMPGGSPSENLGTSAPGGPGNDDTGSTTYETVEDYIAYLNEDTDWVQYDAETNTATVTSLAGFVQSQKQASKDVGAMDGYDRAATENVVLGIGSDEPLHFSASSEDVLVENQDDYASFDGWDEEYGAESYEADFTDTDELGTDVQTRLNMYSPLYYLSAQSEGYESATIAQNWRIRTGIQQGDTPITTELNLALALQQLGIDTDFATIWGQGHTMAELEGDSSTNFIEWIASTQS